MTVHILLLAYICICGWIVFYGHQVSRQHNRMVVTMSFTGIFLVQALRASTVGTDTANYMDAFTNLDVGRDTSAKDWESIFLLLNKVVAYFTENPQWIIALYSFVVLTGLGYFFLTYCEDRICAFWPVFIFMTTTHYFNTMNIVRQYCAMVVAINIYNVLRKDSSRTGFLKAFLVLILAMQFHTTAIVCVLFFVPFLVKKDCRRIVIFMLMVSAGLVMIFPQLLNLMYILIPKYAKYRGSEYFYNTSLGLYNMIHMMLKGVILWYTFMRDPLDPENRDLYRLSFLAAISVAIMMFIPRFSLALRTSYNYDIYLTVLIPELVQRVRDSRVKLAVYEAVLIIGILSFFYIMSGSGRGSVPYTFFFS